MKNQYITKSQVRGRNSLNPLTRRSDQDVTSPYNIDTLSGRQVMRI